jgi:hypothetical protein
MEHRGGWACSFCAPFAFGWAKESKASSRKLLSALGVPRRRLISSVKTSSVCVLEIARSSRVSNDAKVSLFRRVGMAKLWCPSSGRRDAPDPIAHSDGDFVSSINSAMGRVRGVACGVPRGSALFAPRDAFWAGGLCATFHGSNSPICEPGCTKPARPVRRETCATWPATACPSSWPLGLAGGFVTRPFVLKSAKTLR